MTGSLLSAVVSSAFTMLCRTMFKRASRSGEGGRAINLNKWQRLQFLFDKCEEKVAEAER